MKERINPLIKAPLIRGAFYLLLFVGICVIPFALAQQVIIKRNTLNAWLSAPTPTPSPCPFGQYTIADGIDSIVSGITDTGNHCDNCDTLIVFPFSVPFYDQMITGAYASSNGRLEVVTINEPGGSVTSCLPAPPNQGTFDYTIFALWHDMRTDIGLSGCSKFASGCGIFTSVSGSAPNRIFNIEWRTVRFADNAETENFEVRLYENPVPNRQFDVIYGTLNGVTNLDTAGVQGLANAGFFTQDFCNTSAPQNVSHTYTLETCGQSPTPTPNATEPPGGTPTPTPIVTVTPTPTATPRPVPTARLRPTPRPRPEFER